MMTREDRADYMRRWNQRNPAKIKAYQSRQQVQRKAAYETTSGTRKAIKHARGQFVWTERNTSDFGIFAFAPSRGTHNGRPIWL